jgi:mono/diheme cytochrome c family protein
VFHPVWELELGAGPLIAALAVPHVVVAMLSVGGSVLLPVLVGWARARGDDRLLAFARRHALALLVTSRVLGAMTGAGLWFALSAAQPAATEALARALFWPLLSEWVAFGVALAAGLAFAHGFDRLPPRQHRLVGALGAGAALLSLLLADGVLSAMLSPGLAFGGGGFAAILLSPWLLPSALLRLAAAASLAALFLLLGAAGEPVGERGRLARLAALVALPGAAAGPLASFLVSRVAGPAAREVIHGEVRAATLGFPVAVGAALLGAAGLAAVAWLAPLRPRLVSRPAAGLLLVLGLAAGAGAETVREAVRKPWLFGSGTDGAMWAHGLTPAQVAVTRRDGLLPHARFASPEPGATGLDERGRGEEVFRLACRACHTVSGYRAIAPVVEGQPPAAIAAAIPRLHKLRGRMPPFPGSPADASALTLYLASLDGSVEAEPPPPAPRDVLAAGRRVLEVRCLICHRDIPLGPRVKGWSRDLAFEAIGRLPRLNPAMPPFEGTEEERRALAAFLAALGSGQVE